MRQTPRLRRSVAAAAALGVLAVTNVATYRSQSRGASTTVTSAATLALLGIARAAGLQAADLGLTPGSAGPGVARGAVCSAPLLAIPTALLAHPKTRHLLDDDRNATTALPKLARTVLWHIPVGTVLFEEVAFRGVLPALFTRGSVLRGDALSAALFGLWHYFSAHDLKGSNPSVARLSERRGVPDPVWLIVVATGLVGGGFSAARRSGDHLLAPALIHLTINITATLVPWLRGQAQASGPGETPLRPTGGPVSVSR